MVSSNTPVKAFLGKIMPDNPSNSHMHGRQECAAEWAAGRQQCEAVSLTGRACRLAPHGASAAHCSGARLLLASQDGTTRRSRADLVAGVGGQQAGEAQILVELCATGCCCGAVDPVAGYIWDVWKLAALGFTALQRSVACADALPAQALARRPLLSGRQRRLRTCSC